MEGLTRLSSVHAYLVHDVTCHGQHSDLPSFLSRRIRLSPQASAIGKHMVNAKTFLEKRYNEDLELEDAVRKHMTPGCTKTSLPPHPPPRLRRGDDCELRIVPAKRASVLREQVISSAGAHRAANSQGGL